MKFTKGDVKKSFTKCNRSEDGNRNLVRSLFGVVPEYEAMGQEKISGVMAFANERLVRDYISSRYKESVVTYVMKVAKEVEKHFKEIHDQDCEEHCLVVSTDSEYNVEAKVFDEVDSVQSYIDSKENCFIVIVHFLPSVSRDMFNAVDSNNYNISYSNRFSFNGQNFLAKITLHRVNVFGRRNSEEAEQKIADVRQQLTKKFGLENVKTISTRPPIGDTYISGFDITFDKLSFINILKLVNLGVDYKVDIKASLKSMGMSKEEINE